MDKDIHTHGFRQAGVLIAFLLAVFPGACTIQSVYLKPGYEKAGNRNVKRIVVFLKQHALALPPGATAVVPVVANEFVSVQRDYIVYPLNSMKPGSAAPEEICAANTKLDGVLFLDIRRVRERGTFWYQWLRPWRRADREGNVELEVAAALRECRAPHAVVWQALANSTYVSNDEDLRSVTESYVNRLGPHVRPFAAPAYQLVRRLLEELPSPMLSDEEKLEKIDVME